jgi:transcriptional regulator
MAAQSLELLRGTLDLLILRSLTRGRLHGFAVMRFIEEATGSALQIEEGSLYPALYRLEDRGWIESEMGISENNRRARFYRLTPVGRARLKTEVADFRRFVAAVFQVIEGPVAS